MADIQKILTAKSPLTLSSVPAGFAPLLLADLTRGAKARTLFIAADEIAMRGLAESVPFFAPEIEILQFPAWEDSSLRCHRLRLGGSRKWCLKVK